MADTSDGGHRQGAYWGIRTDIANYRLAWTLPGPLDRTPRRAKAPTRLKRMPTELQERLVNWGYAICDAALRAHVVAALPPPRRFPDPDAGV